MSDYLKTYSLSLRTVSPLFIGDGKSLNKKEYIYLPDQKKVLVPDLGKMYEDILRNGLSEQFTEYMLVDRSGLKQRRYDNRNKQKFGSNKKDLNDVDLGQWLSSHGLKQADYKEWIRYSLEGGDCLGEGERPLIATFIKDGYGIPYIPGTSIKGMLRSLLLTYEITRNPALVQNIKKSVAAAAYAQKDAKRNYYLKDESVSLEKAIFHRLGRKDERGRDPGAVNDVLSGLIVSDSQPLVSDSQPLDWQKMILCQKIDRSLTGGTTDKPIILREAVRPGTVINFRLTVDTAICPYTLEDIQKAVEVFNKQYYDYYLRYFNVKRTKSPEDYFVWLGGGTGFFTKTVLYTLMGEEEGLKAAKDVFEHTDYKHKHNNDSPVSPRMLKCTKYKGKIYQMGQCLLVVNSGEKV